MLLKCGCWENKDIKFDEISYMYVINLNFLQSTAKDLNEIDPDDLCDDTLGSDIDGSETDSKMSDSKRTGDGKSQGNSSKPRR